MLTHLSEIIKSHAHELLNRSETMQLVENLKKLDGEQVDALSKIVDGLVR